MKNSKSSKSNKKSIICLIIVIVLVVAFVLTMVLPGLLNDSWNPESQNQAAAVIPETT